MVMRADLRPLELRNHHEDRWLEIVWSDGVIAVIPHRLLREACRCAFCISAVRAGAPEHIASGVRLDMIEPYGPGTLRFGFDDGHSRGLYPFEYLRELPSGSRIAAAAQQENVLANPSSNSGLR